MKPYYQDDSVAIYHGDCREVLPALDVQAQIMWTDPPYGVDYTGKTKDALRISNDGAGGLFELLCSTWAAVDGVLEAGARVYVASPVGPPGTTFRLAFESAGWRFKQELVWVKDMMVLGYSDYHYQHECVLYGVKPVADGQPAVGRGKAGWYGDNAQTSVFTIRKPTASLDHPTMKPAALVMRHLQNSSKPGDTVLDPFLGSGTTLRAAKDLGRHAVGVEIEERYCEAAAKRCAQETLLEPQWELKWADNGSTERMVVASEDQGSCC